MMKIIDISWPISQATTGYKDKSIVKFETRKTIDKDGVRETTIQLDSHTGTHVDAPAHFLRDGKTIDQVSLDLLVGSAKVIDCVTVSEKITFEFLQEQAIEEGDIILFKTINSQTAANDKFTPHFIYLDISGAEYLSKKRIKAVGIDYLGIERDQKGHLTHLELMKHNITIIEGLRLEPVKPGKYTLICLPLAVIGLEASPARAVLIEE